MMRPSSPSSTRLLARLARPLGLALLTGAALLACGGDEAPAGPGPIPLDALREELTKARCEWYARCGYTPDQKTCDATEGDSEETLQLLADAVLGRVTYDPAAARACVEATRTRACDYQTTTKAAVDKACEGMFVGTVAEGGPCLLAEECAGESVCNTSMCMGGSCCLGQCEKAPSLVPVGGDCTAAACALDAFCSDDGAGGGAPTCAPRNDNGQPCNGVDSCKDGMRCDTGSNDPKCYVLAKHDQPCNPALSQGGCLQFDDYCDPVDRKCKRLPGAGEPCADMKCLAYAYCDNGTCKSRPGIGEACMDGLACLGTLKCNNMVCEVEPSTGICAF